MFKVRAIPHPNALLTNARTPDSGGNLNLKPRMRTGGDGQEGLVHGVDVDVVDLVDAHDVAVARQQRDHAKCSAWQQAPVYQLQEAQDWDLGSRV